MGLALGMLLVVFQLMVSTPKKFGWKNLVSRIILQILKCKIHITHNNSLPSITRH
jgi:uncharacterized membrane protein